MDRPERLTARGRARAPAGIRLRPAREEELPICAAIWREASNDYLARLGQPAIPDDLTAVTSLYRHTRASDPERFVVAVGQGPGEEVLAFGSAVLRETVWFLSMLFVRPGQQGQGVGRAILRRLLPDRVDVTLATATDSGQPISNALYASLGIPPRTSLFYLVGRPSRAGFPPLPAGVLPTPMDAAEDGPGALRTVDDLDREVLGFAHPADHGWLRLEGRSGFLFHGADGRLLAYGYAARSGRTGPIASVDPALVPAVLGHLLEAVRPTGASAVWVPGPAGEAMTAAIQAGLRIELLPVLLCWSRPFADFSRYLPISPGLL